MPRAWISLTLAFALAAAARRRDGWLICAGVQTGALISRLRQPQPVRATAKA